MANAFLSLQGVSKSFGGVKALQNVDLTLNYGEVHCLAGENGSGKSTLIKVISGIHEADAGSIRIEGKPVAFSVGEEINPRCFVVHFEKAVDGYNGLYPAINREFAARALSQYEWINREEDMGIEGLRKAKLSYYPELLLEKYMAVPKGETL